LLVIRISDDRIRLVLTGVAGAGKTVLALTYFALGLRPDESNYRIVDIYPPAFALKFAKWLDDLNEGTPPPATIGYEEITIVAEYRGVPITTTFRSMSGELIAILGKDHSEEYLKYLSRTNKQLREIIEYIMYRSDMLILAYDPTAFRFNPHGKNFEEQFIQTKESIQQSRVLANLLLALYFRRSKKRLFGRVEKIDTPVCVAITKTDLFPNIRTEPLEWLRTVDGLLLGILKNRYKKWKIAPIAAYEKARKIGDKGYVPENGIKPYGVLEILDYIVGIFHKK